MGAVRRTGWGLVCRALETPGRRAGGDKPVTERGRHILFFEAVGGAPGCAPIKTVKLAWVAHFQWPTRQGFPMMKAWRKLAMAGSTDSRSGMRTTSSAPHASQAGKHPSESNKARKLSAGVDDRGRMIRSSGQGERTMGRRGAARGSGLDPARTASRPRTPGRSAGGLSGAARFPPPDAQSCVLIR
jgi:hypothetical protein